MSIELKLKRVEELLNAVVDGKSSETIKAATSALNDEFLSNPISIYLLSKVFSLSPNSSVRQLAAIELSKAANKHWLDLDENSKQEVRKILLEIAVQEQNQLALKSLADSISSIADIEIPQKKWPELLPFVMQCCQAPKKDIREFGIYALCNLFEIIHDNFPSELNHLFEAAGAAITDQESELVRKSGVLIFTKFAELLEPENKAQVAAFQEIIPRIVQVLDSAIKGEREDEAQRCMELFESCLLSEAQLLTKHFKELCEFILTKASDKSVSDDIRASSINLLAWTVLYKRTRVTKSGLLESYIRFCMQCMTEDSSDDEDEHCPVNAAGFLLASLAEQLSPQHVYPILGPIIFEYANSGNPVYVKSALLALGKTTYGCSEYLSSKVNDILPLVSQFLHNENFSVRYAACYALYQLSSYLDEQISQFHERLMPQLFALLAETNETIIAYVWDSIGGLMEHIGEESANYLPSLMERSGDYLDQLPTNPKLSAMQAIAIAAKNAGTKFTPYLSEFMRRIEKYLNIKPNNQEETTLRSVALDVAGGIITTIDKNDALVYINGLIPIAFEGMNLEGTYIRESSYELFMNVSKVLGSEFGNYLPQLMNEFNKTFTQSEKDAHSVDLSQEDDDEEKQYHSDALKEKEYAIYALGEIFKNTEKPFLQYLEVLTPKLIEFMDHFSDGIRRSSYETLFKIISTISEMDRSTQYEAGYTVCPPLSPFVVSYINNVMPKILKVWKEEYDMEACNSLLFELDNCILSVGPELISNYLKEIITLLKQSLDKQSTCQLIDEDEDADLENTGEVEALHVTYAADVIGSICKVIGPDFVQIFRTVFPSIKKYFKANLTDGERNMVTTVIGDFVTGLKNNSSEFTLEFLEILTTGLRDEAVQVRSNSAFSIGKLCELTPNDITTHYGTIFQLLSPLFANQGPSNVSDNACGAVCRMILRSPATCPIDQAIPAVIQKLPLKDFQENNPVYQCLAFLIKQNHSSVQPFLGQLQTLISQMIHETPDRISTETLEILKQL